MMFCCIPNPQKSIAGMAPRMTLPNLQPPMSPTSSAKHQPQAPPLWKLHSSTNASLARAPARGLLRVPGRIVPWRPSQRPKSPADAKWWPRPRCSGFRKAVKANGVFFLAIFWYFLIWGRGKLFGKAGGLLCCPVLEVVGGACGKPLDKCRRKLCLAAKSGCKSQSKRPVGFA